MTRFNLLAFLLAAASLALFSTQLSAQTSREIFAGRAEFTDAPATSVPVNPRALAIGPDGNIYVADQRRGWIVRFDPTGGTATSVYAPTGWNGSMRGIAFDPAGNLIVSASGVSRRGPLPNHTIGIGPTHSSELGGNSGAIAIDATGKIYISVENGTRVYALDPPTHSQLSQFAGSTLEGFSGDGGPATAARIDMPQGIEIDAAGNVYFADFGNHRVRRVAAGTHIITTAAGSGQSTDNGDGLSALATHMR